jgi:hypothetical protein
MRILTISLLASMALLIIYVVFYFVVQYVVQDWNVKAGETWLSHQGGMAR